MSVHITIDEANAIRTLRQAMRKHPHKIPEIFKQVFEPVKMNNEMALAFAKYCKDAHHQVAFMQQLVEVTAAFAKEKRGE